MPARSRQHDVTSASSLLSQRPAPGGGPDLAVELQYPIGLGHDDNCVFDRDRYSAGSSWCVLTASRFHTLIAEIAISSWTISFSWKASATLLHTASDTPATLIRVTSSVRASAARSRSECTTGASDQPAITSSLRWGPAPYGLPCNACPGTRRSR